MAHLTAGEDAILGSFYRAGIESKVKGGMTVSDVFDYYRCIPRERVELLVDGLLRKRCIKETSPGHYRITALGKRAYLA